MFCETKQISNYVGVLGNQPISAWEKGDKGDVRLVILNKQCNPEFELEVSLWIYYIFYLKIFSLALTSEKA